MNLIEAISESLVEGCFFGTAKNPVTFKATKQQPASGIAGITHLGVSVLRLGADGIAYTHTFTIDDILSVDWVLKEKSGELVVDRVRYAGIVTVEANALQDVVNLFEIGGYGIIDSYNNNLRENTVTIFCRSHLFTKVESGCPTPRYRLIYEEDSGALTAERI